MKPQRVTVRARGTLAGVVTLALTVLATACGDDATGPEDTPVGVWTLVSVGGEPVPVVVLEVGSDFRLEITAGRLTLNSDGTCSSSVTVRTTEAGSVSTDTQTDVCTWTRNNDAITFSSQDGSDDVLVPGSWSGDTLTLTENGVVWRFER